MKKKKESAPTIEELIETDAYNVNRDSSVVFKELIPIIRGFQQRITDLENQIAGFKYDLNQKVDKQYRDSY